MTLRTDRVVEDARPVAARAVVFDLQRERFRAAGKRFREREIDLGFEVASSFGVRRTLRARRAATTADAGEECVEEVGEPGTSAAGGTGAVREAAGERFALPGARLRGPVAALRLMRLQADDAGVQLRGLLPSEPLEGEADRRALKQIVLNLVSNALKFTPRAG